MSLSYYQRLWLAKLFERKLSPTHLLCLGRCLFLCLFVAFCYVLPDSIGPAQATAHTHTRTHIGTKRNKDYSVHNHLSNRS